MDDMEKLKNALIDHVGFVLDDALCSTLARGEEVVFAEAGRKMTQQEVKDVTEAIYRTFDFVIHGRLNNG